MSATVKTGVVIGAAVLVAIIGVLMFATAGQPLTDESETAIAWINALCNRRADDLYALSLVPEGVDAAAFREQVDAYLSTGEIPQPCIVEVNYNLIRTLVVPASLTGRVDSVRFFGQVSMHSDESDYSANMPIWLYHTGDGWRVWATFLGMTPERPTAAGDTATVLDVNGSALATIRISPPVTFYASEGGVLVGVPVDLQTLSKPWEYYEARLYVDNHRALAVEHVDQLPEELRQDYLSAQGNYSPQNLHQSGTFWFSADAAAPPMFLTFVAQVPYSGAVQAVYLEVPVDSATVMSPFNPFVGANLIEITDSSPAFVLHIDTAGLPAGQVRVECSRFILITVANEWKRATDCTFAQGGWEDFLPDEQTQVTVRFVGYGITGEDQIKGLMYRRGENDDLVRYTLWEPG
jgi:hypothetical protein